MSSDIQKKREAIHVKKSHDYSDYSDVLSNFKRVANAARNLGIFVNAPTGYALFMVLMKLDRLNNLYARNVKPENESLEDTVVDIHNYIDLAYACLIDEGE